MMRSLIPLLLVILLPTPCLARENYGTVVVDRVVSVYDGDTFKVDIDDWPPLIGKAMPIRIADIDCPEIRGGSVSDKIAAKAAREHLRGLLISADVIELRNVRRGKYFRIVADVFVDGVDVKTMLPCKTCQ